MNRRALLAEQRTDLRGHVDVALAEVRAVLEGASDVGPILVGGYAALSALRRLRDVVDELPERQEDR